MLGNLVLCSVTRVHGYTRILINGRMCVKVDFEYTDETDSTPKRTEIIFGSMQSASEVTIGYEYYRELTSLE